MRTHSLPDDVVLDILLRLPVKSVKRFKCICRSWCSKFQEPDFLREHYLTNAVRGTNLRTIVKSMSVFDPLTYDPLVIGASLSRIVVDFSLLSNQTMRVKETINIPVVLPSLFPVMDMVGECEGLILLCSFENSDPIMILNPATQELKTLPKSSVERPNYTDYVFFSALAFGYDCSTGDYKVVRFVITDGPFGFSYSEQVELYRLSCNSWRLITYPFHDHVLLPSRFNTYVNGHCHWWLNNRVEKILAFDMTQETFQVMEFSSSSDFTLCCLEQGSSGPELRVFRNHLAVFAHSRQKMGCFEIWVMEEYGVMESWTKQLVIGPISGVEELLGMWKTGEWFFKTDERRLALFHPDTKAIKDLEIHHCPRAGNYGLTLLIFTESLFSLNGR
ncbi:F-box protein At1g11270-like [Tripterygium wilfordii]|uniref:F-box protein At1g11270-like n=1 Tax=Tripterygium wilfordii TaxID=458696 RepID=UPI0018F7F5EF|nr:F-box protein At1g11270-like [Tripterygium wilfordii]